MIKKSIKARLILCYVLFATLPMLIVNTVSTTKFTSAVKDTTTKLTTQIIGQTTYSFDLFIEGIEKNISKFILGSLNTVDASNLLLAYENATDESQKRDIINQIKQEIWTLLAVEKSIIGATIVNPDGTILGDISGIPTNVATSVSEMKISGRDKWYSSGQGKIYYIQPIKNSISGKDNGYFVADIDIASIEKSIEQLSLFEKSNVFIQDDNDNIICGHYQDLNETEDLISEGSGEKNEHVIYASGKIKNGWIISAEIAETEVMQPIKEVNIIVWLLGILIAIFAVIVGFIVSRGFTSTILDIKNRMKEAENGDLTVEVIPKGRDETGLLALSFNNMLGKIKSLTITMKEAIGITLEEGDLLGERTKSSVLAFEQLAASIYDITEGSTKQIEDVTSSVVAMDKLSDSIQAVRVKTKNVFQKTKNARGLVRGATKNIESLNSTMTSSITITNEINSSIIELSKLNKKIEGIMELVEVISEETHLLALNASIEAARAGDVGRGFGVIAKEVRKLAEQCKASAISVKGTLDNITAQTNNTVELVARSSLIFEEQKNAANDTTKGFRSIIQALRDIDGELEIVDGEAEEMQLLKDDMQEISRRIMYITEENASATESVNMLSEHQKDVMNELGDMATKLNEIMRGLDESVQRFNI